MPLRHTKAEAEAVLRELPSVIGAFVREDVYGHPREVHLLVKPGPMARDLARDVRDLLEEKLGVPVDQRVISIAQVAENGPTLDEALGRGAHAPAAAAEPEPEAPTQRRLTLVRVETTRSLGWIEARVVLARGDEEFEGSAREVETSAGAPRAGARATGAAITAACEPALRVDVDTVSLLAAFDREQVLVSATGASRLFGRSLRTLVGAHPVEADYVEAGALAMLKATNRVAALALASDSAA